ncbi:MAG: malto-oligosyltrehalose synthase [Syntrophotaleaceae bacterium]
MRIPIASYRLQFEPNFGFSQAGEIVDYLKELGISDLYASPIFLSRPGSTHGYDVVDPREINPELGGWEGFVTLAERIKGAGMGWIQDIVPNHMAFDSRNPFLGDVLENGPNSRFHRYFDIDWDHYYEAVRGKVLVPFLASYFSEALENGDIRLEFGEDGFQISYGFFRFPVRPESYPKILTPHLAPLRRKLGEDHPDFIKLLGILYILKTLPGEATEQERYEQLKFVKHTLAEMYQNRDVRKAFDQTVEVFNGTRGRPESFNALESLLAEQWFRLSFWKVACEEINYRRFFTINDLIALNASEAEVFRETHSLILQLLSRGLITGLRLDHVDSIYLPGDYMVRLRQETGEEVYILAEKILTGGEELPDWPIQGTTGYDFLPVVNGVFCKAESEKRFSEIYAAFSGLKEDYDALRRSKKRLIVDKHMFGDINNLAHLLKTLISRHRYGSDITMDSLKQSLAAIMVGYPVYRTYIGPGNGREADFRTMRAAVSAARRENPALLHELDFIEKILLLRFEEHIGEKERGEYLHFVMRFQQYTGTLMAKGVEDTLFYVYNRLLSLNEVGGEPDRFGLDLDKFHDFNGQRQKKWPHAMNATATHDTKRGEDVRARLNVLSEIPREWARRIRTWKRINRVHRGTLGRRKVPDTNDEYFFYQTLVGVYPPCGEIGDEFRNRIKDYFIKAVREAKVHTAWLRSDEEYEKAFLHFIEATLDAGTQNPFWEEFLPFQRMVAWFGILNSLGQALIKVTAPGVPDFYQGTELWDFSLVDPDNRRPVDFPYRKKLLKKMREKENSDLPGLISGLLTDPSSGAIKMYLVHRALQQRSQRPEIFNQGEYHPLLVQGKHHHRVIAFARTLNSRRVVTVVPRLLTGLVEEGQWPMGEDIWEDTGLDLEERDQVWHNVLTGEALTNREHWRLGHLLNNFPVALLVNKNMQRDDKYDH